ncbi:MAG: response regulator [Proteobacteria bacterium]|nr:response regulator [Pseudomonadota bacterium]
MSIPPTLGRLILVDDDPGVRNALRFTFETDGYDVVAFGSGEELLNDPPRGERTCIIIDQRLPGLSGLDTLARLRAIGVAPPAILITSHPSAFVRRRAREADIDIVEKPLLGNLLPLKVVEVLRR